MKKIMSATLLPLLILLNAMTVFAADGAEDGSGVSIGMSIIIALIVAGIACFIAYSSMKSVHTATSAKHYEKEGSFKLESKNDVYINTTKQTIHHEKSNPPQNK